MLQSGIMHWDIIWPALISSAVLTAVINIGFLRYTEGVKARFTRDVETLKAGYAAELAADQARRSSRAARTEAHYAAVKEHAADVAEVFQDLDAIRSSVLGDQAAYYDVEARIIGSERTVAAVVAAKLRAVWSSHPTEAVRRAAHDLYDDVKSFYGDPPLDGRDWPSPDDDAVLHRHVDAAEALIELLHTPPPSST